MVDSILSLKNLSKYFKDVRAVDGLSFQIRRGEIYGLLGPNGAGKSTAIKSIMGYYKVNDGEINVFGVDPIENPRRVKELIGYVSEEPALYESMTPAELFDFIASIRKLDPKKTGKNMKRYMDSLDVLQYYNTCDCITKQR